jgi:hypothetical protein
MEASKNENKVRKLIRQTEEASKRYLIIPVAIAATAAAFGSGSNASTVQQAPQQVAVQRNIEENVSLDANGTAIFVAALGAAAAAEAFAVMHGIDSAMKQNRKKKGNDESAKKQGK